MIKSLLPIFKIMSPPLVLILFLCVSTHACSALFLGSSKDGKTGKGFHLFMDKVSHENWVGAISTIKQEDHLKVVSKEAAARSTSGNVEAIVASQKDLRQQVAARDDQGLEGQRRTMVGSTWNDVQEKLESKENEIVEDAVVMDYAQPHRKPPIHNGKP